MTEKNDQPDMDRRAFLGTGILATATVVAPGLLLTVPPVNAAEGASSDTRWGMLIDTNKCVDNCTACVDACHQEAGIDLIQRPEGQSDAMWNAQRPQWIRKVKLKDKLTGEISNLPLMCQHCEHPPCVDVCPTGASFKRADGIVLVDRHRCIGCRYCMMACPYKARSFIHQEIAQQRLAAPRGKGCVESCTLCVQRIDRGEQTTACQEACNQAGNQAILFGDLKDPESEIAQALKRQSSQQIRADLELNTGVRYSNF
jgi:molybdopterin-containing oxidoreductase family iron-sulfur binding subunit